MSNSGAISEQAKNGSKIFVPIKRVQTEKEAKLNYEKKMTKTD